MKTLIVLSLAILAIAGKVTAQEDNLLLNVLERTIQLNDEYEEFKNATRFFMGDHIRHVASLVLDVVINEIGSWSARFKKHCPTTFNSEAQGAIVMQCSNEAMEELAFRQDGMFDFLEHMDEVNNEVSISVVDRLADFNIITNSDDFESSFDPIYSDFRNRLDTYVVELGYMISDLAGVSNNMPQDVQACIDAGFQKLLKTC
ncbi:uncharacterized protein LOC129809965 [Phlebotomus papatasi]|uniref:Uncharacterized protein n=1 Tax=Phlebotomus papatasi TaxID=29031 RepID=A0A1B0D7Z7_PHLPP|nr:uncharacterized protein LOC129809965 [Phlebotomus papatasi]